MAVKHKVMLFIVIFILVANNFATSATARSQLERTRVKRQIYIPTLDLGELFNTYFNVNIVWGFLYDVLATVLGTRVTRTAQSSNSPIVVTGPAPCEATPPIVTAANIASTDFMSTPVTSGTTITGTCDDTAMTMITQKCSSGNYAEMSGTCPAPCTTAPTIASDDNLGTAIMVMTPYVSGTTVTGTCTDMSTIMQTCTNGMWGTASGSCPTPCTTAPDIAMDANLQAPGITVMTPYVSGTTVTGTCSDASTITQTCTNGMWGMASGACPAMAG